MTEGEITTLGAIVGGTIGTIIGFIPGLEHADNGTWEAIHNIMSGNPFTTEGIYAIKYTVAGALTGGVITYGVQKINDIYRNHKRKKR